MSSCCADDACTAGITADDSCRVCGARAVAVDQITLKAMLTSDALRRGIPPSPRFCATPECSVVYFDAGAAVQFMEADVLEPVHAKHPHHPEVSVCYCFGVTPGSIAEEVERTGASSASCDIAAEVKKGHCACEVRNPKGSCCLGDVTRIETEVARQRVAR